MDNNSPPPTPVTVIVRHRVMPGKEQAFEDWLHSIVNACSEFDGYMGTEVIRPLQVKDENYACIFRFDSFANLEGWMESKERIQWLGKTNEFSETDPKYDHYHSMEFLFSPGEHPNQKLSRIKMTLMTMLGLSLPVHFIPPQVAEIMGNPIAITFVSLTLIVPAMVYLIMPALTRLFSNWLY